MRAQEGDGRFQILDALIGIKARRVVHRLLEAVGRQRVDLDAGLQPPEQIGADRNIALSRVVVGEAAHFGIRAENLLHHDDAGRLAGDVLRQAEIGGKATTIGGVDRNLGHRILLLGPETAMAAAIW